MTWPEVEDEAGPADARAARRSFWTLVASSLASSLAFLDYSMTNIALPSLRRQLGGTTGDLQWTMNGYALSLASLILFGGVLGDRYGRRRILRYGLTTFGLASLGCALAPTFPVLVAMRALQGAGAALLMPNSLGLLNRAYPTHMRGRVIGTWAAVGMVASAAGPAIGGGLTVVIGWRGIFLVNLPIVLLALAIVKTQVEESETIHCGLDWLGVALSASSLFQLSYLLTLASDGRGHGSRAELALLLGGCGTLVALVVVEMSRGDGAMMPLRIFASRSFASLSIITFVVYGAYSGLLLVLPYLLMENGYTPLQAGLALLPIPAIIGALSKPFGSLSSTTRPRWFIGGGSLAVALGYGLLASVASTSYVRTIMPATTLLAVGMAGLAAPLTAAVLGSVDPPHAGTASGFNSMASRSGGMIATALSGSVLSREGIGLLHAFQNASLLGATAVLAAAAIAWTTL